MNEPTVNDNPYILTKLLLSKCHSVFFLFVLLSIRNARTVLFMCVQYYLFAHSAICVRTVLFVRVRGYLWEYSASVCVRCNLCAYSATCLGTCVRIVHFVCVQSYLWAYSAIYVREIPFLCAECCLCACSSIYVLTAILKFFRCAQCYLCS